MQHEARLHFSLIQVPPGSGFHTLLTGGESCRKQNHCLVLMQDPNIAHAYSPALVSVFPVPCYRAGILVTAAGAGFAFAQNSKERVDRQDQAGNKALPM